MFVKIIFFLLLSLQLFGQTGKRNISILTFNILHAKNTDGQNDLSKITDIISSVNPDIVALQEVDKNTKRSNNRDLAKEIGDRLKFNYIFGKAIDFDGGEYGIAILSKTKILSSELMKLPNSKAREQRVLLKSMVISSWGDTILFCNTHLDHHLDDSLRIEQAKFIDSLSLKNSYPSILAGDFNDIPDSKTIKIFQRTFSTSENFENTFPSNNPIKKIDYVLFKPRSKWKVIDSKVIHDSVASDHCAYWVKLKFLN